MKPNRSAPTRPDSCPPGLLPAGSMLPLWRRISQEFLIHGQRWNIPPNVCLTLMHLFLHPGDSEPTALAQAVYFPRQTMTFILDAMEKNGLAVRRPHDRDRRRKTIELTPKGRTLAEDMLRDVVQFESAALRAIEDVDVARLQSFLTRYADALADQNNRDLKS